METANSLAHGLSDIDGDDGPLGSRQRPADTCDAEFLISGCTSSGCTSNANPTSVRGLARPAKISVRLRRRAASAASGQDKHTPQG